MSAADTTGTGSGTRWPCTSRAARAPPDRQNTVCQHPTPEAEARRRFVGLFVPLMT